MLKSVAVACMPEAFSYQITLSIKHKFLKTSPLPAIKSWMILPANDTKPSLRVTRQEQKILILKIRIGFICLFAGNNIFYCINKFP
jgi:hypothetical protein